MKYKIEELKWTSGVIALSTGSLQELDIWNLQFREQSLEFNALNKDPGE